MGPRVQSQVSRLGSLYLLSHPLGPVLLLSLRTPIQLSTVAAAVLHSCPRQVHIHVLCVVYRMCLQESVGFQVVPNAGLRNLSFQEAKAGQLRIPG